MLVVLSAFKCYKILLSLFFYLHYIHHSIIILSLMLKTRHLIATYLARFFFLFSFFSNALSLFRQQTAFESLNRRVWTTMAVHRMKTNYFDVRSCFVQLENRTVMTPLFKRFIASIKFLPGILPMQQFKKKNNKKKIAPQTGSGLLYIESCLFFLRSSANSNEAQSFICIYCQRLVIVFSLRFCVRAVLRTSHMWRTGIKNLWCYIECHLTRIQPMTMTSIFKRPINQKPMLNSTGNLFITSRWTDIISLPPSSVMIAIFCYNVALFFPHSTSTRNQFSPADADKHSTYHVVL